MNGNAAGINGRYAGWRYNGNVLAAMLPDVF